MNEKTFLDKKYKLINGIIDIFRSMVYLLLLFAHRAMEAHMTFSIHLMTFFKEIV